MINARNPTFSRLHIVAQSSWTTKNVSNRQS